MGEKIVVAVLVDPCLLVFAKTGREVAGASKGTTVVFLSKV
jgi:hypothetical protein